MDKFFEILKMLLSEPEKIKSNIISVLKIFLTIVFAEWLYKHFVGKYHLINFLSLSEWIEFILKGRMFICILIICVSYILLFHLLPIISALPFWTLAKVIKLPNRLDKNENSFVRWSLRKLNLLDIDEKEGRLIVMKNTDILKDIAEAFSAKESRKESREFKDTLMSEIGHTYFVFCVLYFLIFQKFINIHYLNFLIIVGFVLIVFFYASASVMIDLMHKISKDLIFIINWAYYEEAVFETMKDAGLFLRKNEQGFRNAWQFNYDDRKYLLMCHFDKRPIDERLVERLVEVAKEKKVTLFVFSNTGIIESSLTYKNDANGLVIIKFFQDEIELITQLKEMIYSGFAIKKLSN